MMKSKGYEISELMPASVASPASIALGMAKRAEKLPDQGGVPCDSGTLQTGEIIAGSVLRLGTDGLLVDIGLSSPALVPFSELRSRSDVSRLTAGQQVRAYVLVPGHPRRPAVLSIRRALIERAWQRVERLRKSGGLVRAHVIGCIPNGLILNLGVAAFLPLRRLAGVSARGTGQGLISGVRPAQALIGEAGSAAWIDRQLVVRVIDVSRERNRVIVSQRAALDQPPSLGPNKK